MSWQQLVDILRENADELRRQEHDPPVACPDCGEPLAAGPNGILRCKFDGWTNEGG